MLFFFFNDTATTEIYTLSLHDALPISHDFVRRDIGRRKITFARMNHLHHGIGGRLCVTARTARSEEHTSELQSRQYLVCRLLLEKKKHDYSKYLRRNNSHRAELVVKHS